MTDKFVDLEALNIRSAPDASTLANRIGILHLGQPVKEIGPASAAGWVEIAAELNGATKRGLVKAEIDGLPSLREPVSPAREALVAEAIKEWLRFEKGQGLEHHDPFFKFVGQMWQAIGQNLDGKDRDVPWSAAAISFMVRHDGAAFPKYKNFKFAAAHARYLHDSIVQRKANNKEAPFWGFRLHENRAKIGDIVGRWRITKRDFSDAENSEDFKSHTDIIVSVRPDFVLAIGGNVRQSVNITRYVKTGAGHLAPENKVFIHLVNQV
ncbi:MAG: DUF2272 domain-containing protein [Pseudomonadota bacterium]|nr:DUF2272 domain-containing protein [Pseudomonadota bacterium]